MSDLAITDCRPEVLAFAVAMERELRANDHKTHWRTMGEHELLDRLKEEVAELEDAGKWTNSGSGYIDSLRSECADVANFAMMIVDTIEARFERHKATEQQTA